APAGPPAGPVVAVALPLPPVLALPPFPAVPELGVLPFAGPVFAVALPFAFAFGLPLPPAPPPGRVPLPDPVLAVLVPAAGAHVLGFALAYAASAHLGWAGAAVALAGPLAAPSASLSAFDKTPIEVEGLSVWFLVGA